MEASTTANDMRDDRHGPAAPGQPAVAGLNLSAIRRQLQADFRMLSEETAVSKDHVESDWSHLRDVEPGQDEADQAMLVTQAQQDAFASDNSEQLLRQTAAALHRLDTGSYGVCEGCQEPIGAARLEAYPRATLCLHCRQATERR